MTALMQTRNEAAAAVLGTKDCEFSQCVKQKLRRLRQPSTPTTQLHPLPCIAN